MSFLNPKPAPSPTSQTYYQREAPGIEERKLELMDIARDIADVPINLPDYQVAQLDALEKQGITAAGTTGVGAPTVGAGIGSILNAATPVGQQQINQYLNPYQQYVTDEIARQGQMMQNQLGAKAVGAGAFGGGREGVQQAELQGRTLSNIGQSLSSGFQTALGAAQRQQQVGLAAGQQLGQMGQLQQQMAQGDINQLMAAGGLQRQLAQATMDAQRQSTLQQQYEPYQRAEFLANLYAAGPKTQSGITMGTGPSTSPLAQSVGTGIAAFSAFSPNQTAGGLMSLNKVLNRPMFRREALRKGVLKPIRAKVGIYAGPGYKQGPEFVPQSQYSKFPLQFQGPKGKSFAYDPKSGSYITGYGKGKIKSGTAKFAKGLTGLGALYAGAEMAGIPDPLLQTAAFSELASLPLGLAKGKTAQTVGRILGSGSRLATSNPLGAIGIGGALALTGGAKAYYDESKMVKDYARANNIDYKKALDIFNRDLSFGGGRPMTASDVGKMVIGASSARDLVKGGLDKTPEGPPGSKSYEQRVAGEMRQYMEDSKQYGRYFQDVDQLVKKVKDKQRAYSMAEETASMSPDDAMQFDQVGGQIDFEEKIATVELRNALMAQKNLDINKASNLALAITGGEIEANDVDAIVKSDELYAQVPNNANDPNHPKFIKEEKTVKEIDKKNKKVEQEVTTGENEQRDTVGENDKQTGDPEVDNSKKLASTVDIAQFLRADPRNTQMDPNRVMLMKLAAGLLSGKSMQGGLAGAAEIFGAALGPAIDAKVLVKMKNDEAYRDWASQVLTYNASLYKARNDAVKMKLTPGSFAMPDGTFAEARRDKETGDVYISQNGQLIPVNEQQGQFFEQKSDALLFDNVKLIADGYLSDKLLSDSIQLMESNKGKTAIGASGIFVNLIDLAKNIPGELRDGFFGANPTFEISQGDLSDKEYKKLQKRTNSAVEDLEEGIEEFLKNNPEASSVLAKLRVNARMLTYSLANSLKDKDRLTNRDLELIEQLTKTMTAGMTDEKIISQYKELLKAVREKNKIRIGKLGISGYTQQDTTTILNSMGLGSYAPKFTTEKEFDIDSATAAFNELMGIK